MNIHTYWFTDTAETQHDLTGGKLSPVFYALNDELFVSSGIAKRVFSIVKYKRKMVSDRG